MHMDREALIAASLSNVLFGMRYEKALLKRSPRARQPATSVLGVLDVEQREHLLAIIPREPSDALALPKPNNCPADRHIAPIRVALMAASR